jgi:SAM-dependent methyltransferase
VHAASEFYDLAGFRAGGSTLRAIDLEEVGDVTGKRLLHLQCHMGQDTLSWARRGAQVTGLDFSAPAIRTARALAEDTGLADRARFVVSDVYAAPEALEGQRFDIVVTGVGALVWLPDVPRWAKIVASLLDEGGFLHLSEFHPFTDVLDDDGRTVAYDYFGDARGARYDIPYTYTDGPPLAAPTHIEWQHSLGEVVSSLAAAGLRIEFLHEHPTTLFRRFPVLEEGADGTGGWGFPAGSPRIPMMYSLRARRTA